MEENRVALVTGAGSGIGAATAARLAMDGMIVYRADRAPGSRADGQALALDVRDEDQWVAVLGTIRQAHERLDVLVNSAGVTAGSPLVDTTLDEWRGVLRVNLDGAFLATKHGIRAMRDHGGAIIHVGSASGIRAAAGAAAYSTSKAALRMLAQVAAKECQSAGWPIRVNVVSPAGVKTPLWRGMPFFQDLVRTHGSEQAAYNAMTAAGGGRFLEPDDVAKVISFLASDHARDITGVELPVDNGYTL